MRILMFSWLMALTCIALSVPALAGRFDTSAYECEQISSKDYGVKCAVKYIDGMGQTLLIRVHRKATDPEERGKRIKYIIGYTIHNFLASGGTFIMMRTTNREGRILERSCSRIKGRDTESCHDWHPVEGKSQLSFMD